MDFVPMLALAAATFVSEDLACVTAGLLVARGDLGAIPAVAACAAGIVLGDCGLWLLGRCGGLTIDRFDWLRRRVPAGALRDCRAWLERRGAIAILVSRFLPGTRLPLYVTAGAAGMSLRRFVFWTALAATVWTPGIVLASAGAGGAFGGGSAVESWTAILAAGVLLLTLRSTRKLASGSMSRHRLVARLARWRRWEFWPMWLFYAPVALWVAWLSLRYRGLTTLTAANPGIADGGTVGESKHAILQQLPEEFVIASLLIDAGDAQSRTALAEAAIERRGWSYPLVLKPDVGQRGLGVRLARSRADVRTYLERAGTAVLIQPYHEGPFEAGVFYYRMPGSARGQILSVTDKQFPMLVGDGVSTLEQLVYAHPRYRLQADVFLRRHAGEAGRVLRAGERLPLAMAGNHAQGTLFLDGRRLITPALEERIDAIARRFDGFFIGRFDIRYRDVSAFMDGRDIAIVELNGATAESTRIYDPANSLLSAYRELFRQWSLVFRIGAENRRRGHPATPLSRLIHLLSAHLTATPAFAVSD